jgi:hypothetical protein
MKSSKVTLQKNGQDDQEILSKDDILFKTDLPFSISETGINAYVGSSFGVTINLGNFESLRVDTSVSLPCYPNTENIDLARQYAEDILTKQLMDSIKEVKENTQTIKMGIHQTLEGSELINE